MTTFSLGGLKVQIGADTSELDQKGPEITNKLKKIEGDANSSAANIAAATTRMAAIVATALAGMAYAMERSTKNFVDMRNSAISLGISVENFSKLGAAAAATGIPIENVTQAVTVLAKRMVERDWASEGVRTFQALGISVNDASGNLKSADQLLVTLADRFAKMQDGVQKTNIAISLFGDAGTKMLSFLNQGSSAIQAMEQAQSELGSTISGKSLQGFEDLNGVINTTNQIFNAFTNKLVSELSPTFQVIQQQLVGATKDTDALAFAAKALGVVFDGLVSVGILMKTTFMAVFHTVATLTGAVIALAQGDFNRAMEIIKTGTAEILQRTATDIGSINAIWEGWSTTTTVAADTFEKKVKPPIVKTAEEIANAFGDIRRGAQDAFGIIMDDPLTPFTAKLEAASVAVQKNAISWREFNNVVRQAKEQQRQNLNDMLTLTGTVLTTLFQKNKAAAIASALINTYTGISNAIANYPPPISFAMAGLQAALGFAQVRNITSTSQGSTGGGASAGADVSAATSSVGSNASTPQPQAVQGGTLTVQGINPSGMFSGDVVRDLADRLLQYQRDGGKVVLA